MMQTHLYCTLQYHELFMILQGAYIFVLTAFYKLKYK